MKAKILKFGKIAEVNGRIIMDKFDIQGDGKLPPREAILILAIERLSLELDGINVEINEILFSSGGLVLVEVAKERVRQDKKWGGAEHDDEHHVCDFSDFINDKTTEITLCKKGKERKYFIEIAALAVAAVESIDRKNT